MYTVEYYDDEDQRPVWCVVAWTTYFLGDQTIKSGKTIERCDNSTEAESIVHALMLIDRLTTA
jgi:hypothetical protein